MPSVSRIFKLGGKQVLLPSTIEETAQAEGWAMPWSGKVNSVSCPRGRQYGEAHFLVSQKTLDALDLADKLDITCKHEDGATTWAGWYAIRTQAVTRDTDSPAHWITLADRRWVFERVACQKRYNLRVDDENWVDSTLNSGTPYTWQEVLNDLWDLLPAAIAMGVPSIASGVSSTPENLIFDGVPAWQAINQVLTAVGCAIAFDPITETFTCPELKEDQSGLSALKTSSRSRMLWQFSPHELPETNYPEKVKVTYQKMPSGAGADDPFPAEPTTDEAGLGEGGITGTSWPIRDTLFARDSNASDRTTRTGEIKDALIGLLKPLARPWGAIYSGVIEFETGSELTEVIWSSDGARGMRTIAKHSHCLIDWIPVPATISGGERIEYKIDSLGDGTGPYTGLVYATAKVMCGPGALVGTTVTVYDHSGCIFDEDTMTGYTGWAFYGQAWSLDAGDACETLTPKHWIADNRCCSPDTGIYAEPCA